MMKQLVYLTAESTNWRVNNVMDCLEQGNFPNIAKTALKYLAVPASSAPSERVFSQLKLILDRKRWRTDADRLERICFYAATRTSLPNSHPHLLNSLQAVSIISVLCIYPLHEAIIAYVSSN